MKNVIITGAAGFLGSHIANHHLALGDKVLGLDDYSTSLGPDSGHVQSLIKHKNCMMLMCDITELISMEYCVEDWTRAHGISNPDLIYNFACPASPPKYQEMPIKTMLTCVVGTKNMLSLARKTKSKLIHASTSEIYGDPDISPQPESYRGCVNSYGPRSCYDEGKRAAEALCYDYYHKYNVDARMVRIFNTYGDAMDPNDGRVVTNFVKQVLLNEPITVYGKGDQTRSFCYVDDLIRGITGLASLKLNPRQPINVGNPSEFTIMELAELILELVPESRSSIELRAIPIDDPKQRCPNIDLAKEILDWQPNVTLKEGLKLMIPYMKRVLSI